MKKSLLIAAAVATLFSLAACSAQSQTPQVDDELENLTVSGGGDPDGTYLQNGGGPERSSGGGDPDGNRDHLQNGGGSERSSADGTYLQNGGGPERGVIVVDDDDDRDGAFDRDADDNMRSGQQLPADSSAPVPDETEDELGVPDETEDELGGD